MQKFAAGKVGERGVSSLFVNELQSAQIGYISALHRLGESSVCKVDVGSGSGKVSNGADASVKFDSGAKAMRKPVSHSGTHEDVDNGQSIVRQDVCLGSR